MPLSTRPEPSTRVSFAPTTLADFEVLVALRTAAMRESLEQVGRFYPARARERLGIHFIRSTPTLLCSMAVRSDSTRSAPWTGTINWITSTCIPAANRRGIGSYVLLQLLDQADGRELPVHVGALKESASNRFYQRQGFLKKSEDTWDIFYVRPAAARKT